MMYMSFDMLPHDLLCQETKALEFNFVHSL